jgi:hypothetical protein
MFFPLGFGRRPDVRSTSRGDHAVRDILPVTVVMFSLTFCLACSSISSPSPDSRTGSYFQNPDRVWAAILETLIDLDYEVAESNRYDGKILTEPREGEDLAGVVLSIDQIMRTSDQVNVYVRPSAGAVGNSVDPSALKAAGDQFMTALDKKLQG